MSNTIEIVIDKAVNKKRYKIIRRIIDLFEELVKLFRDYVKEEKDPYPLPFPTSSFIKTLAKKCKFSSKLGNAYETNTIIRVSTIKKVLSEVPEKTSYAELYKYIYKSSVVTIVIFITAYNYFYGKES
jgi:hypothetical protein